MSHVEKMQNITGTTNSGLNHDHYRRESLDCKCPITGEGKPEDICHGETSALPNNLIFGSSKKNIIILN